LALLIGVGIASYYLLPLEVETKYLYYGQTNPFSKLFLNWQNVFWESWPTHIDGGVVTRVQQVQIGILETFIVILGILITIKTFIFGKKMKFSLLALCVIYVVVLLFFLLPYSLPIYTHTILRDIQFPWRMLAVFIFIPPFILALLLTRIKQKEMSIALCIVSVLALFILRLPQLYGKDYVIHPLNSYDFTTENLNSVIMNTIWTGETQTYPVEKYKAAIISGKGEIVQSDVHNDSRKYQVIADTPIQMVDYTFYFPGWIVKVDGQQVPIQYQDPHYRGVITYAVPSGKHTIVVSYTATKVRQIADVITFVCLGVSIILLLLRKKMKRMIFLKT